MKNKKLIIKALKHGMSLTEIANPLGMKKSTFWVMLQKDQDYLNAVNEYELSKQNIARDILEMSKK